MNNNSNTILSDRPYSKYEQKNSLKSSWVSAFRRRGWRNT